MTLNAVTAPRDGALPLTGGAELIALASETTAPIRELVYGFVWENPISESLGERGTIKVDVLREQPDTGLVVVVSEQGERRHNALPATCVVNGATNVLCDPNATVNPEEYTLLRFLGEKFVDPSRIDDRGRWQYDETRNDIRVKATYRIVSAKGEVVGISEVRDSSLTNRIAITTQSQTTIHYDLARLAPLDVDEWVTRREQHGPNATVTTVFETTLTLKSDSLAQPSAAGGVSTAEAP